MNLYLWYGNTENCAQIYNQNREILLASHFFSLKADVKINLRASQLIPEF